MIVPIANIFGFLGSLLGSSINAQAQREINQQNLDFAREMWQNQVDYADKVWQRESDWNSPAQALQRIKDAGLNPNLLYGQGVQASGATPTSQQPRPTSVDLKAPQVDFNSAAALGLQSKLVDAQSENLRAEAIKNLSAAAGQDISNQILGETGMDTAKGELKRLLNEVRLQEAEYNYKSDLYPLEIQGKKLDNLVKDFNSKKLDEELKWLPAQLRQNYIATIANIAEAKSRTKLNYSTIALQAQQQKVMSATISKLMAETNLTYEQASYISKNYQLAVYNGETDRLGKIYNFVEKFVPSGETGNIWKILGSSNNFVNSTLTPVVNDDSWRFSTRSKRYGKGSYR